MLAVVWCRRLWDRPEYLNALLSSAQQRAVTWVRAQKRHHGTSWGRPSLGSLLQGFFDFYSDLMTEWVLGKRRWAEVGLCSTTRSTQCMCMCIVPAQAVPSSMASSSLVVVVC